MRRAIAETEQGLRVQATLKKIYETRQVDIEAKQRQLLEDKNALEKEAAKPNMDQAAVRKKYEKLMQLDADIQRAELERQREMQRKEAELTAPIYSGILEAVKRIAAQDGYEMVLEKSVVQYFRSDLEVTDRAIQMYNGGQVSPGKGPASPLPPAVKGAPAPAPAPGKPAPPASPAPKK
jgi:outer membrane protein